MQVRRGREEGSEAPGICVSVAGHRKAFGTNDPPPIHALPGDEGRAESARSNQVAGISGPESRRLGPLALHHGRGDVMCPHRTLRVHEEYDSQPKWRVMAKAPPRTSNAGRRNDCHAGQMPTRPFAKSDSPERPDKTSARHSWRSVASAWRDRHAPSIANPWKNLSKIRHSARRDGRDG